ncbi:Bacteriophage CI repressor helix-turn-helix domain-containing protein [Paenimyroides aquimaris]|uniref:Bacteriophage CI repressor helix-turn-helix domain-containing protein n=1 Tax=Paenimyroides marinum TaxID=1159016 RepID=A0A1H6KPX6_9FLAO|nr:helix-turn-helix transcriptional regulator [Paenimyroides aquimaris]SEH73923.1 Bacteriophage CI repressor helix-turn-helix domain-containing protein [Paenimyroides aquimaris]
MKFSSQLQKIMHHFSLTTTELADKITVPKATISHLISERNKPSLEFIMKLHTHFPTLNLEWLIYGKEPFLITENFVQKNEPEEKPVAVLNEKTDLETTPEMEDEIESHPENIEQNTSKKEENILSFQSKEIDCIVIFYNDGSFKQYKP